MATENEHPNATPTSRLESRIGEMATRLRYSFNVERIWTELLTEEEREQVKASKSIGPDIIDIWRKLKKLPDLHAVVDLAHEMGSITPAEFNRFQKDLAAIEPYVPKPPRPRWNEDLHELTFNGAVIRQIKRPKQAKNVVRLLNAFEEAGWPERLDDPLPYPSDSHRLRETIQSLNTRLAGIRFEADGTGEGIRWKPAPAPSRAPAQLR